MQINFTKEQLAYLTKEANKQRTTIETYIQQLVDIQMDVSQDMELGDDMTVDMWNEVDTSEQ